MRCIVYYHKDCLDGFGSAWAAWKKFGDDAEYIGLLRENDPVDISDCETYFIDFTYSAPIMQQLKSQGNRIIALDHHISQEDAVKMCDEYVYDIHRSGCMIAWQYFHPNERVPELLCHIQDNDLFTNLLPEIKEIISALSIEDQSFENFSRLAALFEDPEKKLSYVEQGKILLLAREKAVSKLIQRAEPIIFEGIETLIVNSFLHYSEAAAVIYRDLGFPLGMAWSYCNGRLHVSLRSDGITVDCAALAKKYGGGGHRGAAGFNCGFHGTFPWISRNSLKISYERDHIRSASVE